MSKAITSQISSDLDGMGPTAKNILKAVLLHGGDMDHVDIVKNLRNQGASDADIMEGFGQCRGSMLIWDKLPTPFNQHHTWNVSPTVQRDLVLMLDRL